jgi:hypothetical protein
MKSTIGRPRSITDEHVTAILRWHAQILAWKAQRTTLKTKRQLAKDLGLTPSAVSHVIACHGQFKQPSPEKRLLELYHRHDRRKRLRSQGFL